MSQKTNNFDNKYAVQAEYLRDDTNAQRPKRRSSGHISKRKKRRRVRIAVQIGIWVCAAVFIVGGVIAGKAWIDDSKAEELYSELRVQTRRSTYDRSVSAKAMTVPVTEEDVVGNSSMDFAPLKEINSEIVAWLICDGTVIDYPVLHTEDNEYYLNHLYTKEENRIGALFVDYRNTGLFTERNTVIYGHNMKSGAMFNSLSEYKQQDYYDAFPTITLYTPDGDYTIELFSGTVEDGNYEFVEFNFENDEAFLRYIDSFRERSTFQSNIVLEPTDRIITLCTCSYEWNNARYMLMGRLVRS